MTSQFAFPPVEGASELPLHLQLMSGQLADAVMLLKEKRSREIDINTGMMLGAGYPMGPLSVLRGLPESQQAVFQKLPELETEDAATVQTGPVWDGKIGIVGSGHMARGIVEAILKSDRSVCVSARSQQSYDHFCSGLKKSLNKSVEKGRFSQAEADLWFSRQSYAESYDGLKECDFIIEAVLEDLKVKRNILSKLDACLPEGLPIATNTSSFRVSDFTDQVKNRTFFAFHFFNPAHVMKLVELVYPQGCDEEVVQKAEAFAHQIKKAPITCTDRRGFVVNRLLIPFLNDAVRAHEAGYEIDVIDLAMTEGMGHPMGPLKLIDLIGIDVMVFALKSMAETEGDPRIFPAETMTNYVRQGRLGRKTKHGFYTYD